MWFELRLAVRALGHQRSVTLAAILTVALAVAANTALFTVFDGLLFRPLPFANVDRVVHIEVPTDVRRSMPRGSMEALMTQMGNTPLLKNRYNARPSVILEEGAADVQAWGLRPVAVSKGWFSQFGVVPVAGPLVDPGNDTGFLMGEDLWCTRYGADESLIGKPLRLPGMIFAYQTVLAGIVPREFSLPDGANVWFGYGGSVEQSFNFATLADDVSIDQVRAMLPGARVTPLREHVRPDGALALAVLLAATALLMIVAWVQVAALLFARAAGRAHEVGIRLALGAGRSQLIRQFATEGVVIAFGALVIGWLLTPLVTRGVVALLPEAMTVGQLLSPDLRAVGFAAGLTLLGVMILALAPIDVVRRGSPLGLLRGSTVGGVRLSAARWRTGMLVAQLAVTVMLLYMSGLAAGSASRLAAVDLGFDSARVLAFRQPPMTITSSGTPEERRAHLNRQVQAMSDTYDALRVLPGVVAVAGGRIPLLESRVSGGASVPFQIRVGVEAQPSETAFLNTTTPDYARVLGLTTVEGRLPAEADVAPGEAVTLVNQAFADILARRGPVLGQQLTANNRTSRVIGVVKNFVVDRPDRPVDPMMLVVLRSPQAFFLVRLEPGERGDHGAAAVGATFERIWPGHPSRNVMAVDNLVEAAIADYRARATMLVLIGVMCLPLALVGITGALNYSTELRTREIGIRLALGAVPHDIRRAVGKTALLAAMLGLGAGLAGGVLMGRLMSAYLFGVNAVDPATIAGVAAILAAVGWCASWLPARRASNIQPAVALRHR